MASMGPSSDRVTYDDSAYRVCLRKVFDKDDEKTTPGYKYLSIQDDASYLPYCRDMTLARGRILYEVVNNETGLIMGYLVNANVLEDCEAHDPAEGLRPWEEIPMVHRRWLCHAYGTLIRRFPGLRKHPVSTKIMAEELYTVMGEAIDPEGAESVAVRYARRHYTQYDFLRATSSQDDTLERIKPRMRSILRQWLGDETRDTQVKEFEKKWDVGEPEEEPDEEAGAAVFLGGTQISGHKSRFS